MKQEKRSVAAEQHRHFEIGPDSKESKARSYFPSNVVSTTKYELWNIIPKNLFEQFQRCANVWFLIVSICQLLPLDLSPTASYATILPLSCVLLITFIKDAYEDWGRRRDDTFVNNQFCTVVHCSDGQVVERRTRWRDVEVGDYLKLSRDTPVPADIVLLSSSHEDGVAYVDTVQLDGEMSLKPKFALEETMRITDVEELQSLQGHVDTELPNELVQSFNGTLHLRGHPRGLPIDIKNFILRGSTIRNTSWVLGLVVFSGVDTKLVRNSKGTPSKKSRVEAVANRLLVIVFALLCTAAVISCIARALFLASEEGQGKMRWVWPEQDELGDNNYLAFITFMIGFNNFIPISLYVTTDLVRTFQAGVMERDRNMYHKATDTYCRVKNSALNENLGQVEFILTDKTGTLTENKMVFKACSVGDKVYGCWDAEKGPVDNVVTMPPASVCQPIDKVLREAPKPKVDISAEEEQMLDDLFLCLATCHTAIVEEDAAPKSVELRPDMDSLFDEASRVSFRSSSPDEEALVTAARGYGFFFRRRSANKLVVNVRGEDRRYVVLVLNEFSSERKRMSVLVRYTSEGEGDGENSGVLTPFSSGITSPEGDVATLRPPPFGHCVLYAKGADNVMLDRLSKSDAQQNAAMFVQDQLKSFSNQGLRTLVCARRVLTEEQARQFEAEMQEAKTALMYRDKLMEEVANRMEREMEVVGVTAIEDKIQQGVPETVSQLLSAGVKVWMLTGDNMETAINIGLACRLSTASTKMYTLDGVGGSSPKDLWDAMDGHYGDISRNLRTSGSTFKYCFVVHGSVLYTIMEEKHARLRQLFLAIACASEAVIACRLAPAQKAALVKLVRTGILGNPLTLAIGDGGNDVSMIQEAHVGVGIRGLEGQQAANAADFVISQFRFLRPLLFVHGSRNLRRIGIVIAYSFYKNCVLVLPMCLFGWFTGFTGTTMYDSYLLMCYNIVTFLPILIVGVFDFHVPIVIAQAVPSLYQLGIRGDYWNSKMLVGWLLRGVWHAVLVFITMRMVFMEAQTCGNRVPDWLAMGSWSFWACVAVVNAILALHLKAWMDWLFLNIVLSVFFFVPGTMIYSQGSVASIFTREFVGVGLCLFGQANTWLGLIFVTVACSLIDLAISSVLREVRPTVADVLLEVSSGHLAGVDRLPPPKLDPERLPNLGACAAWEATYCKPEAKNYLSRLPPPPIRLYKVRPEGGVKVKPLGYRNSGVNKQNLRSIVPLVEDGAAEYGSEMMGSRASVVSVPQTKFTRMQDTATAMWNWLRRQQWREIIGRDDNSPYSVEEWKTAVKSTKGGYGGTGSRHNLEDSADASADGSSPMSGVLGRRSTGLGSHEDSESSESSSGAAPEMMKDLLYSIVTLRFYSEDKEFLFRQYFSAQAVQLFKKSLAAACAALVAYNMYELVAYESARTGGRIAIMIGTIPLGVAAAFALKTQVFADHSEGFIVTIVVSLLVGKHLYDYATGQIGILANSYMPVFFAAGTRLPFPLVCSTLLVHGVLLLIRYYFLAGQFVVESRFARVMQDGDTLLAEYFVLMMGLTSFSIYSAYLLETLMRQEFMVLETLRQSKQQAMEFLRNMFPEQVVNHVVAQMRKEQGGLSRNSGDSEEKSAIREDRGIVTVLFCDVCDFDALTSTLKPVELVQLLDLVWALFDKICDRHGLHKIETVGKTYMCAAMPEDPNARKHDRRDALAAVETAIGMLEAVARRCLGIGKLTKISVRIGIHSGRALSGVVGSQKPQFALFGDTVNTASRMQSTGENDHVHISGFTWEYIKDDDRFQWDKRVIKPKGKDPMDTYLLQSYDLRRKTMDRSTRSQDSGIVRPHALPPPPIPDSPPPPTSVHPFAQAVVVESPPHEEDKEPKEPKGRETKTTVRSTTESNLYVSSPTSTGRRKAAAAAAVASVFGGGSSENSQKKKHGRGQPGQDVKSICISFLAFLSCYAGVSICVLSDRHAAGPHWADLVLRLGYLVLSVTAGVIFYFLKGRTKKGLKALGASKIFSNSIAITTFIGFVCSVISNSFSSRSAFWGVFETFFFATVLMHLCRVHLQGAVPAVLGLFVFVVMATMLLTQGLNELLMESVVYLLLIAGTQLLAMQGDPRRFREDHIAIAEEHKRVNSLLDSMLPCEVLAEMKSGRLSLAYEYEDVTFLFADIVGFTNYCAKHTPEQAVNLVTRLFADFDECTVSLGVYKVCTIGDAYVVVNQPRATQPDALGDCEKVFALSKKMLKIIVRVRHEVQHDSLDMRIGLHYGRFIGGVIGTKRLRFDVWGEDVLIGNSIESHGRPGNVCVSEQAKNVLQKCASGNQLSFPDNVDITLKNQRVVKSYLCTRTDGQSFVTAEA